LHIRPSGKRGTSNEEYLARRREMSAIFFFKCLYLAPKSWLFLSKEKERDGKKDR
jgi:hypothetical protein